MAPITHIVLFQYKADMSATEVKARPQKVNDEFFTLKRRCVHPTTRIPYIVSLKGGVDNSPEGLQGGITHAFVVEFASAEDRDYYVTMDPAHLGFVKGLGDLLEKAQVIDFTPGTF
ncbi:hypothetical protein AK830_g8132 [Neonectria ditissima]|uniref:Stress-response A/B barrel domain-containing protein n=1 Tax=Neonectria ditissima TaxID=78410 RepID=A0A0P7BD99_9HYPO|nr:hypothetical protein AK830_g8132 [Neonectria ditissima]